MQTLWRTVWRFLKKLTLELPYDPASHFWLYSQRKWMQDTKEVSLYSCVHCSIIHNSQRCLLTDEWIKKLWEYIYTHIHINKPIYIYKTNLIHIYVSIYNKPLYICTHTHISMYKTNINNKPFLYTASNPIQESFAICPWEGRQSCCLQKHKWNLRALS